MKTVPTTSIHPSPRFALSTLCLLALAACGGGGGDGRFNNGPEPGPAPYDGVNTLLLNPPKVTTAPQSNDPAAPVSNALELWKGQPVYIGFSSQKGQKLPDGITAESSACPDGVKEAPGSNANKRIFFCTPKLAGDHSFSFTLPGNKRLLGLNVIIKDPSEQSKITRLQVTPKPVLLGQPLEVRVEGEKLTHALNPRLTLPGCALQEKLPGSDSLRVFNCIPKQSGHLRLHVWLTPDNPATEYIFSKSQNDNVEVQDPASWIPKMEKMTVSPESPKEGQPFNVDVQGQHLDKGVRLEMPGCAFHQETLNATNARWTCTPTSARKDATITLFDSKSGEVLGSRKIDISSEIKTPKGLMTLNDTGSKLCHFNGQEAAAACNDTARQWVMGQDGLVGRDIDVPGDADGRAGFQFAPVSGHALDQCVQDQVTGLVWQGMNAANSASLRFSGIQGRIDEANAKNLCGRSDWRLPSSQELASLIDMGAPSADPKVAAVDAKWLPNTPAGRYFSNSRTYEEGYKLPTVDFAPAYAPGTPDYIFAFGGARHNLIWPGSSTRRNSSFYLRLVAGASSVGSAFDMEPDANAPRYIVLKDRRWMRDRVTNLVWQRCVMGTVYKDTSDGKGTCEGKASWLSHADALAEAQKQVADGWRMPNIKEMMSLHQNPFPGRTPHEVPLPDIRRDYNTVTGEYNPSKTGGRPFWSSTANGWSGNREWVYRFDYEQHTAWALPRDGSNPDDYKLNTRLVRDARAGD